MSEAVPFEHLVVDRQPAQYVFLVIGIPGSGKSTISEALAKRFPLAALKGMGYKT